MVESEEQVLPSLHKSLIGFNKRAERTSVDLLVATFVDSAPLFDLLATPNNQVIYGRRGTGKTHALKFLSEQVTKYGDLPIYLDLRSVGSNGSIYGDTSKSLAERASVLVVDVLTAIHDELYQVALGKIDAAPNPAEITIRVDDFARSISTVEVKGIVEPKAKNQKRRRRGSIKVRQLVWTLPQLNSRLMQNQRRATKSVAVNRPSVRAKKESI